MVNVTILRLFKNDNGSFFLPLRSPASTKLDVCRSRNGQYYESHGGFSNPTFPFLKSADIPGVPVGDGG